MTTAFVAGATGYTGREVVRQLCERGVRTIAHVRPDSPRLGEWHQRFTALGASVDATPWEPRPIEYAMQQHEPGIVFGLLGTTRGRARAAAKSGAAAADYATVDFGMTRMLLRGLAHVRPSARYVYLSSIGARIDARNEYLQVRGRIEEELMTSGLGYVIARPAFITGPDRDENRPLERVGAAVSDGVLKLLASVGAPNFHARFRSISSQRLARALISAALDPSYANSVLDTYALHELADHSADRAPRRTANRAGPSR